MPMPTSTCGRTYANDSWTFRQRILHRRPVHFGLLWPIVACLLLAGCATPQQHLDQLAEQAGFERLLLAGKGFHHVAYRNAAREGPLHVYLEGDGTPWLNRYTIAPDPTPRRPLALELMARDPAASLYLGRPCYHGLQNEPGCSPLLWTARRYGPTVVVSLSAALHDYLARRPHRELVLIGYSGGGVLAMLLAERFPQTRAVVTIAADLDIEAWTTYHGFSPLLGSLNPARRAPLPVNQLHLAGGRDDNVPPALIRAAVADQPCAQIRVLSGYDHRCCWSDRWPELLQPVMATRCNGSP